MFQVGRFAAREWEYSQRRRRAVIGLHHASENVHKPNPKQWDIQNTGSQGRQITEIFMEIKLCSKIFGNTSSLKRRPNWRRRQFAAVVHVYAKRLFAVTQRHYVTNWSTIKTTAWLIRYFNSVTTIHSDQIFCCCCWDHSPLKGNRKISDSRYS